MNTKHEQIFSYILGTLPEGVEAYELLYRYLKLSKEAGQKTHRINATASPL